MAPSPKISVKTAAQRGSALFVILIAVVLFASLAYAVSSMLRGGNPDMITGEKSKLAANEILAYARSLRQGALNIKISNGCSDADISFENPIIAGYEHAPAAFDNCKLFSSQGGGLVYQIPPEEWLDMSVSGPPALRGEWYFPSDICVPGAGSAESGCAGDGADNESLIVILPYIKKMLCTQINDILSVPNPGGNPPAEAGDAWPATQAKYTGASGDGVSLDQGGRMAGCFEGDTGSTPGAQSYHFYQVLVPR